MNEKKYDKLRRLVRDGYNDQVDSILNSLSNTMHDVIKPLTNDDEYSYMLNEIVDNEIHAIHTSLSNIGLRLSLVSSPRLWLHQNESLLRNAKYRDACKAYRLYLQETVKVDIEKYIAAKLTSGVDGFVPFTDVVIGSRYHTEFSEKYVQQYIIHRAEVLKHKYDGLNKALEGLEVEGLMKEE